MSYRIIFIVSLSFLFIFLSETICAQSEKNGVPDTIFVSDAAEIGLKFSVNVWKITNASVLKDNGYKYDVPPHHLTIWPTKKNTKPVILTVELGDKQSESRHQFLIAYKEDADADYDFSDLKKLAEYDKQFALRKPKETIKKEPEIKPEEKKEVKPQSPSSDYGVLITEAEEDINKGAYDDAEKKFKKALSLRPDLPTNPQSRVLFIKEKKEEIERHKQDSINIAYGNAKDEALKFFNAHNYIEAKKSFEKLLIIRPEDFYANHQIKTINDLITQEAEQKKRIENEENYRRYISEGYKTFNQGKLEEAKINYQQALIFKNDDLIATSALRKIEDKERQVKDAEQQEINYQTVFNTAEKLFGAGDMERAKDKYNEAYSIIKKPELQERIKQINKILNDRALQVLSEEKKLARDRDNQKKYDDIIISADEAFDKQNYILARKLYVQSQSLNPSDQHATDMIGKIKDALDQIDLEKKASREKEAEEKETNTAYNAALTKGNTLYKKGDLQNSQIAYTEASSLKPLEDAPQKQLAIINKKLQDIKDSSQTDNEYSAQISLADSLLFRYAEIEQSVAAYKKANSAYQEAQKIKSLEDYPVKQIKYINSEINRIEITTAAKAATRRQEILDSTYKDLINRYYRIEKSTDTYKKQLILLDSIKIMTAVLQLNPNKDLEIIGDNIRGYLERNNQLTPTNNSGEIISTLTKPETAKTEIKKQSIDTIAVNHSDIKEPAPVSIPEKASVKDTAIIKKQLFQGDSSINTSSKKDNNQSDKEYILQKDPIPYPMDALQIKYPNINFSTLPPEIHLNAADNSTDNNSFSIKILSEKPRLDLQSKQHNINLICEGISFNGLNSYIRLLVQNADSLDFLTGPIKLIWNKQSGDSVVLIPGYIFPSYLPIILPRNEINIIYVIRAKDILNQESLTFELNDRVKKISIQLKIPGSIYNREKP